MPLWNLYFLDEAQQNATNLSVRRDWFADVEGHLFYEIVCRPLNLIAEPRLPRNGIYPYKEPLEAIRIIPAKNNVTAMYHTGNALGNKYWSEKVVITPDMNCLWIDFFDWSESGYRQFEYVRCRLHGKNGDVEALVKFDEVKVFVDR